MSTALNVYYIDDDTDDQETFVLAIKEVKAPAITLFAFQSGSTFIRQFARNDARSVIFLDINMPGKSGFDVLKELREKHSKEELPVIMYSTSNDGHTTEKSKELGANLYLVKAFSHKGSVANISKVLNDKMIKGVFKVVNG